MLIYVGLFCCIVGSGRDLEEHGDDCEEGEEHGCGGRCAFAVFTQGVGGCALLAGSGIVSLARLTVALGIRPSVAGQAARSVGALLGSVLFGACSGVPFRFIYHEGLHAGVNVAGTHGSRTVEVVSASISTCALLGGIFLCAGSSVSLRRSNYERLCAGGDVAFAHGSSAVFIVSASRSVCALLSGVLLGAGSG